MASSPTTTTYEHQGLCNSISTIHPDIITQILTRLDGRTLVATASTSSHLRSLSSQDKLWKDICRSTWPSTSDPHVQTLISIFPSGHRSFFSDSFPVLDCQIRPSNSKHRLDRSLDRTTELISAVDIHYRNNPFFSKVVETETVTGWFEFSPFRIDLLDEKQLIPTPITFADDTEVLIKHLEENLTLSWIIIDSGRDRAVNLSSRWPVSVQKHWLTHDVHLKYATIIAGDRRNGLLWRRDFVECEVTVTLGGKEGGEMYVREVSMQMKDMEDRNLRGRESLVILQRAIENGERKRGKRKEGKERYEGFMEKKRKRKEGKERREKILNMACLSFFVISVAFWSSKLFI